jgi:hypothetical protein
MLPSTGQPQAGQQDDSYLVLRRIIKAIPNESFEELLMGRNQKWLIRSDPGSERFSARGKFRARPGASAEFPRNNANL